MFVILSSLPDQKLILYFPVSELQHSLSGLYCLEAGGDRNGRDEVEDGKTEGECTKRDNQNRWTFRGCYGYHSSGNFWELMRVT